MKRYQLSSAERGKLERLALHDLDMIAKRRARKHEQAAARDLADRQALREALQTQRA
jgi:hypothetical protein